MKNYNPFFSIIVPVYNVSDYIEQCVESVLTQKYSDYELIIVDDGSTDSSGQICDRFSKENKNVKVIHTINQGTSTARNNGIKVAAGEYILFLDGDDYWKNDSVLESIFERICFSKPDVLSFNFEKIGGRVCLKKHNSNQTSKNINRGSFEHLSENDLWVSCVWNKAIRRSLIIKEDLLFRDGITSEDIDWCVRLALCADIFDFIDTVIVCYRQREESVSKSMTVFKVKVLLDNIEYCLDLIANAKDKKRVQMLKRYMAYQFGAALQCLSMLPNTPQKYQLLTRCLDLKYLLNWSDAPKIQALKLVSKIGGLKLVERLLHMRSKMI